MRKLSVNKGGMSRPPKQASQAKKVLPPAVPEPYRHSGSSFGSAGYASAEDNGFMISPDTPSLILRDDHSDYGGSSGSSKSPGVMSGISFISNGTNNSNQFNFPARGEPLTHQVAVFYHQQLALQEDQGIDLTQSPGRDSPSSFSGSAGSGSRHSTASLDSGRSSSYLTGTSTSSSNRSGNGGGVLSSPRCSVSSCSIGSVDRMSNNSGRNDHDVISDWLNEIQYDEYTSLFTAAGYDLPTLARMTPEDLTAIGIKKPHHREKIKQHIDVLKLPDSLPNYVPGSIEEWLRLLRLEEYVQQLLSQGYETVRDVTQLTWEDLEDIGIVKLGHQKKILLAIKRVKDIISGKLVPYMSNSANQNAFICPQMKGGESFHPSFTENDDRYFCPRISYEKPQCRRSYDDGDITPTNEMSLMINNDNSSNYLPYHQGGGTLPRQHHRNAYSIGLPLGNSSNNRNHPIAKVAPSNLTISPQLNQQIETCIIQHAEVKKPTPPLQDPIQRQYPYYHNHSAIMHQQQSPFYSNYAGQTQQTTAEIHYQQHDNKSNSSLDSIDQIPFANENAGTIKQRAINRNDHQILSSSSSSSSTGSVTTTIAPPAALKSNLLSYTNPSSKQTNDPTQTEQSVNEVNILNDIGNMLANLTDELDAMLQEEKNVGLNEIE